ncbi:MAG TPA: hypothetical protein VF153_00055, partial [Candidatus Limnocylindria bacterium]
MAERGAETGRGRSRVLGLAVALLCALTAALPAPAPASTGQVTIFDAAGGLTSVGPAQQAQMLDRLHSLGVDVVRIVIPWRAYVPNPGASKKPAGFDAGDPSAYPQGPFNTLDAIIRGAYARGMTPLLTPSSPIPDWASASG